MRGREGHFRDGLCNEQCGGMSHPVVEDKDIYTVSIEVGGLGVGWGREAHF